jgi:diguanylate cyclase (GGDEF)-like protein
MELRTITTAAGVTSALVSAFLGLFALKRRRNSSAAPPFALLMLANAIYAAAYTLEIHSRSLEAAISWLKVEYFGVTFVPVFWYLFSRAFVNETRPMKPGRLGLLSIVPAVTLALMCSNEAHGLVYASLQFREGGPISILVGTRGAWYWVNTAYLYTLMLFGTVVIVAHLSRASGKFRGQTAVISCAVVLPWLGHGLLLLEAGPYDLDLTPFLLAVSGALLAWGIFKFSMFDLVPIARDAVFDAIRDGVVVLDRQGRVVDVNEAAREAFPELARMKIGSDALASFASLGLDYRRIGGGTEFARPSGGAERHYKATSVDIQDNYALRGSAIIIADTTETKEVLARLERLVSTDELTQVDNRRRFFEHAERELELARRRETAIAFAMFDLDHFKRVNDSRGHAAGDAALVAVCGACREMLRSTDILCRYGGEEFMIILPEASPDDAMEIVERVRHRIGETAIAAGATSFFVTASFGVTGSASPPYLDLESYLRRCDEALYRAKDEGRNRAVLYSDTIADSLS